MSTTKPKAKRQPKRPRYVPLLMLGSDGEMYVTVRPRIPGGRVRRGLPCGAPDAPRTPGALPGAGARAKAAPRLRGRSSGLVPRLSSRDGSSDRARAHRCGRRGASGCASTHPPGSRAD